MTLRPTDLTEQRFNLFAYMQTFSAICYVLGYSNIWTAWQIGFRMTVSLCYFGDTVGRQVGQPRKTLGPAALADESHCGLRSRQNQKCKCNNLMLLNLSSHHKLTKSPTAISDPYAIQSICMALADILQDPQETHHIPGSRWKTGWMC